MASKKDDEVEVFSRMDEDGFFEQYGEDEEIILEHPDEGVVSASEVNLSLCEKLTCTFFFCLP